MAAHSHIYRNIKRLFFFFFFFFKKEINKNKTSLIFKNDFPIWNNLIVFWFEDLDDRIVALFLPSYMYDVLCVCLSVCLLPCLWIVPGSNTMNTFTQRSRTYVLNVRTERWLMSQHHTITILDGWCNLIHTVGPLCYFFFILFPLFVFCKPQCVPPCMLLLLLCVYCSEQWCHFV